MAKKSYYKPKPKKEVIKAPEVISIPLEEVKEELLQEIEIVDDSNNGLEIQISPLTPEVFCKQKSIIGLIKDFLEKKYATKSYTLDEWDKILIKEKIN